MKPFDWKKLCETMRPHLLARHDFDDAQAEIVEVFKAEVLLQVRAGHSPIDSFVLWRRNAGDIDMAMVEAIAIVPREASDHDVARVMRPRIHSSVQTLCKAMKARAISSIGIAPNASCQGVVITHEAARFPARAWLAPGLVKDDWFPQGIGDLQPLSQTSVPPEVRFMWNLLPLENYAPRGTTTTRGGQA